MEGVNLLGQGCVRVFLNDRKHSESLLSATTAIYEYAPKHGCLCYFSIVVIRYHNQGDL